MGSMGYILFDLIFIRDIKRVESLSKIFIPPNSGVV